MLIDYATRVGKLPKRSGVYFVYAKEKLVYIGHTWNFANRLYRHSKRKLFANLGVDRLALLPMVNDDLGDMRKIQELEKLLILRHRPLLNLKVRP